MLLKKNMLDVCIRLINTGYSNYQHQVAYDKSVIFYALENRMYPLMFELLDRGDCGMDVPDPSGAYLFEGIGASSDKSLVNNLRMRFINSEYFMNNQDKFPYVLMVACKENDSILANTILDKGFNQNNIDKKSGNTALIFACSSRMTSVAKRLIVSSQETISRINNNGNSALLLACSNNMSEVAMMILDTGKYDLSHCNMYGMTPLLNACYNKMTDVCLRMIDIENCNIMATNKKGDTALMVACKNDMIDVALKLIPLTPNHSTYYNKMRETAWDIVNMKKQLILIQEMS